MSLPFYINSEPFSSETDHSFWPNPTPRGIEKVLNQSTCTLISTIHTQFSAANRYLQFFTEKLMLVDILLFTNAPINLSGVNIPQGTSSVSKHVIFNSVILSIQANFAHLSRRFSVSCLHSIYSFIGLCLFSQNDCWSWLMHRNWQIEFYILKYSAKFYWNRGFQAKLLKM